MTEDVTTGASLGDLRKQVERLRRAVAALGVVLLVSIGWLLWRAPALPRILSLERLDIVEPDGSLAFVLANSQRPPGATMDGQTLLEGQQDERRGVPSFIFFDGKGDEVGGFTLGVRTSAEGFSATRHLSLDGYKQDQTVVLAHYQDAEGSSAGLRISDRPLDLSMVEALAELGLEAGPSRKELEAAIRAVPGDARADRLRDLFGVQRLFVGSDRDRNASLVLRDGAGRPRILLTAPADGTPSIQILDETGEAVLTLPSP
jgi:hypothetical protein